MTIAITGAAGQLGRLIIHALKARLPSSQILALARSPEKADDLGLVVRRFDYAEKEALPAALAGVQTLLLISSSEVGQRAAQHRNVIQAAKQAGVGRIVYTSLLHADSSPLSLASEHRETESDLQASGIPCTILRNGWYTENYIGSVPAALANGAFIGSAKSGRISSAPRVDYAQAAVTVLTNEGHDGATYELAADEAYTLADLAAELSRQTGREIQYVDMSEVAYAAALVDAGLPKVLAQAIASWDAGAAEGALFDDSRQLSTLIGRATTPLADVLALALK